MLWTANTARREPLKYTAFYNAQLSQRWDLQADYMYGLCALCAQKLCVCVHAVYVCQAMALCGARVRLLSLSLSTRHRCQIETFEDRCPNSAGSALPAEFDYGIADADYGIVAFLGGTTGVCVCVVSLY